MDLPETDSEDEMPPGWEERCTADGQVFYAHHSSQTTQWTHPRTNKRKKVVGELPYGWERQITEDGKVFFVDHVRHKTTYTDPRLAFALEETRDLGELRQRFDASSTGLQVLHGRDLTGKVAVVTGANCGIGYETARTLAFHGCTVVLACRCLDKARQAIDTIQQQRPNAACHALPIDLADLASVRGFVQAFTLAFGRCDILVLNAGVFGAPHTLTTDGFEATFQVNFLAHLYLGVLLAPLLARCAPARVVWLSGECHRFGRLDGSRCTQAYLSPSRRHGFSAALAYSNAKLCCVLGALEMQRRFGPQGVNSYAVHPGNAVCTYITRHWWGYRLLYALVRPFTKSLQQACATTIYCAAGTDIERFGGVYVNNCIPCQPCDEAMDETLANRLWALSISMIESVLGQKAFNVITPTS